MPYNRNIYILNFEKLAHWLTPTSWRTKKFLVYVRVVSSTWNDLYNRFVAYRNRIKYNLLITPQVCFLEKALNDRYDVVDRRIFIDDGTEFLPLVLFTVPENKPLKLYTKAEDQPLILYTKSETSQFGVDFIVHIPAEVSFDMPELRAFVTGYKLCTKTFSVQLF